MFQKEADFVAPIDDTTIDEDFVEEAVGRVLLRSIALIVEGDIADAEQLVYKSGRNLNAIMAPEGVERGALMH